MAKKLLIDDNPTIAAQWHPTLNAHLNLETMTARNPKKVWWLGECGHEWYATVAGRAGYGEGCSICANKKVLIGFNDLQTIFPDVAKEWNYEKNSSLLPTDIVSGTTLKVWWICNKGHEWDATVYSRTNKNRSNGCSVCYGHNVGSKNVKPTEIKVPRKKRVISVKLEKSLATVDPKLAAQLHRTLNKDLTAETISAHSDKKVWWLGECGHEWKSRVAGRTKGKGCTVCAGRLFIEEINDLATLYPSLSKEWHSRNTLPATKVMAGGTVKYWWLGECGHEWKTLISARISGTRCPYCYGNKTLLNFNDLRTSKPLLAVEWHPTKNGDLHPEFFSRGSGKKIWWLGLCGHEWPAKINGRANGINCPRCANHVSKAEETIVAFLWSRDLIVEQSNRKILNGKELDIFLPEKNLAIEFNGLYWHTESAGKDKFYHYNKWLKCKEQGIQLIQIWEDDWIKNQDKIINMISVKAGVYNGDKVFARKTTIHKITAKETEIFLKANHIQEFASGSIYVGLKDGKNKLVAAMVLRKAPNNDKNLILTRYATNMSVVGGFTKLLKYVEKEFLPKIITTFSDNTVSDGSLYENNGFIADLSLRPNYMYVVNGIRKHKFGYRLKGFKNDPDLLWNESMSERELAILNNIPRIWDAGKTRWIKNC